MNYMEEMDQLKRTVEANPLEDTKVHPVPLIGVLILVIAIVVILGIVAIL